jgi:hypothetical protein
MPEYRAYILAPDGHIQRRVEMVCDHDDAAMERAKQLVDGHDVELSQGTRELARSFHKE